MSRSSTEPRHFFLTPAFLLAGLAATHLVGGCAGARARSEGGAAATPAVTPGNVATVGGPRAVGGAPTSVGRPIPYRITSSPAFARAVERGTRTETGEPGPRYWQQTAHYELTARLFPEDTLLVGTGRIRYVNRSPDSLTTLQVDLLQNIHAAGAARSNPEEVTGGVVLKRVAVGGTVLDSVPAGETGGFLAGGGPPDSARAPGYHVVGTRLVVVPPRAVPAGGSVELAFDWQFKIPGVGASGRMGRSRDNLYFIAYWYPQMVVYDDVVGWHPDPFLGTAEFYADFADYDVTVEAPAGWVVIGTGELTNGPEVLPRPILDRLTRAEKSDEVVNVLGPADFGSGATLSGRGGRLEWRFRAGQVRDFAFSATRQSVWDAVRSSVGDRDGDGDMDYARVDAVYRELAPRWKQTARYGRQAVSFHSRFTGLSYPWPHMTVVEGAEIIGGGMEFPMLTLIGDYNTRGDSALYNVTVHEIGHMWVPMIVGNDERRYGWMDEGITTFNENQARKEFFPGSDPEVLDRRDYATFALTGDEGEMMRRSDFHYPGDAYVTATYAKPATALAALRGVLGEEDFLRAYRAFIDRWKYKHPYPWDFFNTFEAVSGRDLDWFWRSWYYETWLLDHAVGSVSSDAEGTRIVIEDRGLLPMPVAVRITRASGETLTREIPVDVWLSGATSATITLPPGSPVTRVEVDPGGIYPDVDHENDVWSGSE